MKKLNLPDVTATNAQDLLFYQIPQVLFDDYETFSDLNGWAILLYAAMLNRVKKKGSNFTDKDGRLCITFTIEEIMQKCRCASQAAKKYMKQLEDCGLIEKKLQGGGRPALIYVKDFAYYESDANLSANEDFMELYRNGWGIKPGGKPNNINKTTEIDSEDDDDSIYLPGVIVKAVSTVVRKLGNTDKDKE